MGEDFSKGMERPERTGGVDTKVWKSHDRRVRGST